MATALTSTKAACSKKAVRREYFSTNADTRGEKAMAATPEPAELMPNARPRWVLNQLESRRDAGLLSRSLISSAKAWSSLKAAGRFTAFHWLSSNLMFWA